MWLSWLTSQSVTEGLWVQFPVRANPHVAGDPQSEAHRIPLQVDTIPYPGGEGRQPIPVSHIDGSLCLPSSLSKSNENMSFGEDGKKKKQSPPKYGA